MLQYQVQYNDTDISDTTVLRNIIKEFNLTDLYKLLEISTSTINQILDTKDLKDPHSRTKN